MSRAQVVADVVHGLGGEPPDGLRIDLQEGPTARGERGHTVGRDQPVRGLVGAGGEQIGVEKLGG